jgi:hypothetical protein
MNDHLAKPIDRKLLRRALTVWGGERRAAILEEARAHGLRRCARLAGAQ